MGTEVTALCAAIAWLGGVTAIAGITLIGAAPWQTSADPCRVNTAGILLTVAGIALTVVGVWAHEKRARR